MALPENKGLATILSQLESAYSSNNFSSVLSRADFWALGSYVGLGLAAEGMPGAGIKGAGNRGANYLLPLTFRWGACRWSCSITGRNFYFMHPHNFYTHILLTFLHKHQMR